MRQQVLMQDISDFVERCSYWDKFKGKRVAITGATGLIGSILVKCLDALNTRHSLGMTIYGIVRNTNKTHSLFATQSSNVIIVPINDFGTLETSLIGSNIHYIIHAAAPTASAYFVNKPVETFEGVVELTKFVLERAMDLHCESMVYLSSLECYGEILDDTEFVTEENQGYVDPLNARSSYSMGKRAAECLCYSYFCEYGTPVKIARLAQTFGAGVSSDDNRVYAYIAKSVINGTDVVLKNDGLSQRNYCYTIDSVDAILRILTIGKDGEAYNVANEQTYISVRDMVAMVLNEYSPQNKLVINSGDTSCYPPNTKVKMSSQKIESLGWKAQYNLILKSATPDGKEILPPKEGIRLSKRS